MCLAVPGRVAEILGEDALRMARVDFGGVLRQVSLVYTPEVSLGDYVLVHAGFALQKVDEDAARETLADGLEEIALHVERYADEAPSVRGDVEGGKVGEYGFNSRVSRLC